MEDGMNKFLAQFILGVAVTATGWALPANAQQADEDPNLTTQQNKTVTSPKLPQAHDTPQSSSAADVSAGDEQTQDALAFTGRVVRENGQIVLSDPVTKMTYQLDDQSKAKPFVGKQVKVIGKLDLKSNKIHIESIEVS
jgi:hypothetical protein